jgi:hypothetical protein
MLYRRRLELDVEEIRPELDILHSASRELKASQRFKRVLQVRNASRACVAIYTRQAVLTVGNALNGSSFRGGALGFKLEALLKVSQHINFLSST